jgi:hypothetical protein
MQFREKCLFLGACAKKFREVAICYAWLSLRMKRGNSHGNNFDKFCNLDLYQNLSTRSNFGQRGYK